MKQLIKPELRNILWTIAIILAILGSSLTIFHYIRHPETLSVVQSKVYTYQTSKTCSSFMTEIGNPSKNLPSSWKYTSKIDRCIQSITNAGSGCKITYLNGKCLMSIPGYDDYLKSNPRIYDILSNSIKNYYDPNTIESERWNNFKNDLLKEAQGTDTGTSFDYYRVLAHIIYIDKNRIVPWKLNNYDDTDLGIIFSDYKYIGTVKECSPSSTFIYTKSLIKSNQANTIYSIVDSLRIYYHTAGSISSDQKCIEDVLSQKTINGCHEASQLMAELSRNLNIPAYYIYYTPNQNWFIAGHGGVVWPKIAYLPHGDQIYGTTILKAIPSSKLLIPWSILQNKIIPKQSNVSYMFGSGENPIERRYMFDLLAKYPPNMINSDYYSTCLEFAHEMGDGLATEQELINMVDKWNCIPGR